MSQPVRFGVQIGAVDGPGVTDADLYREAVVDAKLTQELGFDAVWLVEHHFSDYYPTPNPLPGPVPCTPLPMRRYSSMARRTATSG